MQPPGWPGSIAKESTIPELGVTDWQLANGVRVIVKDIPSCYLALGAMHSLYKPIPGKFKDYIAIPKANGYQSIHTDLIGPHGVPVRARYPFRSAAGWHAGYTCRPRKRALAI